MKCNVFKGNFVVRKNLFGLATIGFSMVASLAFVACGDDDSDDIFNKSAWEDIFGECDEDDDDCSSSSRADGSNDDSSASKGSNSAKNGSSSSNGANSCSSSGNGASSSNIPKDTIKVGFNEKYNVSISTGTAQEYYTGIEYKTVQIGAYEWMAENLRTTGNVGYCYDSDSTNCETYGRLYFTTVPECPRGFDLPTKEQWNNLFAISKGTTALKSKSLWKKGKAAAGTNELGFNALPAGTGLFPGEYSGLGTEAKFMIALYEGYYSFTNDSDQPVYDSLYDTKKYVSIRCVKLADEVASEKEMPAKCSRGETIIAAAKKYACSDTAWVRSVSVGDTCYTNEELMLGVSGSYRTVCKSGNWYKVTTLEDSLGYCDAKHAGDTITYQGTLYGCSDLNWHKATIRDVYGECLKHETSKVITYDSAEYICADSSWKKLTANDSLFGLCNDAMDGYIVSGENGNDFICRNHSWKTPTRYDILGVCDQDNYGKMGEALGSTYICKSSWTTPSTLELRYGGCTSDREGMIIDSSTSYVCKNKTWTKATLSDLQGVCNKNNEGESVKITGTLYVCHSGSWDRATSFEVQYGVCTKDREGDHIKSGYVCENLSWRQMKAEEFFGACTAALQDTIFGSVMCDKGTWRKMNSIESNLESFCNGSNLGKLDFKYPKYYQCTSSGWTEITDLEYSLGGRCDESKVDVAVIYKDTTYTCIKNYSKYSWKKDTANAVLGPCNIDSVGILKTYKGETYNCKDDSYNSLPSFGWYHIPTKCEKELGFCTRDIFETTAFYDSVMMYCTLGRWVEATRENFLNDCDSEKAGQTKIFFYQEYTCDGKGMGWKPIYGSFTDTRDGHVYRTVSIADRLWLADNLSYETSDSWCANEKNECDSLGRLYTWKAAQSACPEGWRLSDVTKDQRSFKNANIRALDSWQGDEFAQNTYSDLDVKAAGLWLDGRNEYKGRAGGFWMANEEVPGEIALTQCIEVANATPGLCPHANYGAGGRYISQAAETVGYSVRCVKEISR